MTRVIGVDAYALGWVAVELHDGAFARAMLAASLYEIIAASSSAAAIGVNIALGIPADRWRTVETVVAEQLGARRGSVQRIPPWPVWQEADFTRANKRCRELTGTGLSRQSWGLRSKVLEANAIRERHPTLLFEANPELSFRTMAGEPLIHAKKTWTGHHHRRDLLARHGIVVPHILGPAGMAPPDDILDAAAIAWSAHRKATGTARSYPSPPEQVDGTPVAVWT
ncbi:DUF429 domain-containing protein [Actinoplanes sp. NPDC049316]|uniref:DUF429 domain-containing protein n=1 Tax=Actinoplanes sp. NPDC049316 TaxID=3154727 RepID=UPI0034408BA5